MKRSKLYRNGVGISGMDFTSDGILITHPSKKEIVAGTQFEPTVTAQLSPGFFYIGDREFYYYNRKATEYHKADVLLNLITITLANYPMGFVPYIRWRDTNTEAALVNRGMAPIILRRHRIVDLPARIVLNDTIYHDTGISGKYAISYNEDGTLNDIGRSSRLNAIVGYPHPVTPFYPYAKCYEYWRSDEYAAGLVPPDQYHYDFETNTIRLQYSEELVATINDYIYVVEYEARNTPIAIPVDLNPLETVPADGVICIELDSSKAQADEVVAKVITTSTVAIVKDAVADITVKVLGKTGNPLPNETVTIKIVRDIVDQNGTLAFDTCQYVGSLSYSDGVGSISRFDRYTTTTSGALFENNMQISDGTPDGVVIIPSVGYFLNGATVVPDIITLTTDSQGIARTQFSTVRGSYKHGAKINIIAACANVIGATELVVLANPHYYVSELKPAGMRIDQWSDMPRSYIPAHSFGTMVSGATLLLDPETITTPSMVRIIPLPIFMEALITGSFSRLIGGARTITGMDVYQISGKDYLHMTAASAIEPTDIICIDASMGSTTAPAIADNISYYQE